MTVGQLYWCILIAVAILSTLILSRVRQIAWRYKIPLCLLLANILPVIAVGSQLPSSESAGGLGIAMMFGLLSSILIIMSLAALLQGFRNR